MNNATMQALDEVLKDEISCAPYNCEYQQRCVCGAEKARERVRELFKQRIPVAVVREMLIRLAKSVAALYLEASPLIRDEDWRRINEMADQLLEEHGHE